MAYGAATPCVTLSQTAWMAGKGTHLLPDLSCARAFTSRMLVHTTVTGRSEHGTFRLLIFELAKLHKNESGTNRGPALAGTGDSTCALRRLTVAWRTFLLQVFCSKVGDASTNQVFLQEEMTEVDEP